MEIGPATGANGTGCIVSGHLRACARKAATNVLYCAITALDRYPSHLDNIHYIQSATLIYVLLPSMDHAITSILDTPYIRLLPPADICLCPS